ncbi:MAG: hypothetical protein OXG26_12280 [Caldilineaceae bacterium]|nr:hypothetical protein [Caldilineaceae bacterium]
MSSAYLLVNAWREIFARVFNDADLQSNVSPDWLINPATRRRLKLDYLCQPVGVAVRFSGLTGKGRRRGDWELLKEEERRDQTRDELCRRHGIQLAVIDPFDDPVKQMDQFLRVLSRASRMTALDGRTNREKGVSMDALAAAVQSANQLRFTLSRNPEQTVGTLAEAWRDREANIATSLQEAAAMKAPQPTRSQQRALAQLACGRRIVHTHFGDGVVTEVSGEGVDRRIKILFDGDQERTFLASLLADKLEAAP